MNRFPFNTGCNTLLWPVLSRAILLCVIIFLQPSTSFSQRGFNYYRDSSRVGSPNAKAFACFQKAYYDHIWKWSREGADSAVYYLTLAIKEDPDYSAAYAFLAHVYQFMTYDNTDWDKKLALEKKYALKAVSYHPKTGDAYSVMSDVLWHEKDTAGAINMLREAIDREPDNVGNMLWLGIRYKQKGATDSAKRQYRRAFEYDHQYGQALMKLGNIYQFDEYNADSAKMYYREAIRNYNEVKPRDNRMMDAWYWMGGLFATEKNYDSATQYYQQFLKEIEPTQMYIREMRLAQTHKALFQCYQELKDTQSASEAMSKLIAVNNQRIAANAKDASFLLGILEEHYLTTDIDSVSEKYALPLAHRIRAMPSKEPYVPILAGFYEYLTLNKLKRKKEAMDLLQALHAKHPKEPLILFELGRLDIIAGKEKSGLEYLSASRKNLNDVITKKDFMESLGSPDFDRVRNQTSFKKLLE